MWWLASVKSHYEHLGCPCHGGRHYLGVGELGIAAIKVGLAHATG
jgi:hypothetical protein